jgi:hypothetical protein
MERQPYSGLTQDEIDAIAERAAERALEKVYAAVGKSVLKRLALIAGAAIVGLFVWLKAKGIV